MKDIEQMLMKLKNKEDGADMDPREAQAKEDVLRELLAMADEAMGSKFKNGMDEMQKVTVAGKNPEDLKAGLDKAKDMLDSKDMESMEEDAHSDLDQDNEQGEPAEHADKVMVPNHDMEKEMAASPSKEDDEEEKPKKKKLFSMLDDE